MRLALATLAALALAAPALAGAPRLTIDAAASLTDVLPHVDGTARYSFGGSNTLAAQIEQGAPVDVFASANTKLPDQLYAKRLCLKPVVFTRNTLVVVVPRANPAHVRSVADLTRRGVQVDVAGAGVPVGSYTAQVLRRLGLARAIDRNVVSRETDVREVLAKVALGEADAGFVYATDAKSVAAKVRTIRLPARAQPDVRYAACVVAGSGHRAAASAWVQRLLAPRAQRLLRAAGFLAVPLEPSR